MNRIDIENDKRFAGINRFEKRVLLASPTMHKTEGGDSWRELEYIKEAFEANWITCAGSNLDEMEATIAKYLGAKYVVGLSCGTSAIHMAIKLAAERLYGSSTGLTTPNGPGTGGCLYGVKVFCTDFTFDATVNPVLFEGGEQVFIDSEYDTWNMDPRALERAFKLYPDVKLVIVAHLYGTPAKIDEIKRICEAHGALLIEDAAESLGATYGGKQTSIWGDYGIISFNGNKVITGSTGGALICTTKEEADKARKWSTQSREPAPWYEHKELGYNYRMSNITAGIVRGQFEFINEHIVAKKAIYERYKKGFEGLPINMNPLGINSDASCWLSCALIDEKALAHHYRSEMGASYEVEHGKSSPTEILETLDFFGAEGRPIWKPMHMQPIYKKNAFVTAEKSDDYGVSADIFDRGLCLPSDNKMTVEDQDKVIDIIRRCFI